MSASTARLGLTKPAISDDVSVLRTAIGDNADGLDNAVVYFSDTISNRGTVVSSPKIGYLYYGTDTALWYVYNGSAWQTLIVAGGWTSVSLGFHVNAVSGTSPSWRIEGDIVRMKGALVSTQSIPSTQVLFSVTSAAFPPVNRYLSATMDNLSAVASNAFPLIMQTNGQVIPADTGDSWASLSILPLDGLTYTLS